MWSSRETWHHLPAKVLPGVDHSPPDIPGYEKKINRCWNGTSASLPSPWGPTAWTDHRSSTGNQHCIVRGTASVGFVYNNVVSGLSSTHRLAQNRSTKAITATIIAFILSTLLTQRTLVVSQIWGTSITQVDDRGFCGPCSKKPSRVRFRLRA